MSKRLTSSLRGLLVLLGLVSIASLALAQPGPLPFDPTHYWTYHLLEQQPLPQPIFAKDQFFRQGVPLTVERRERLLNWVHKNNSAVPDTFIHYTWWNILEKLPVNRQVIVSNQFGSYRAQVLNLEFMLVPAWKNQQQAVAPHANHYLCYRAVGFPGPPQGYDLRDEWRVDYQFPHDMEYLCAPCLKQHQGLVFAPVDTVTHLAVYPIEPYSDVFYPLVADQFLVRPEYVQQEPVEYLFVPSEKTDLPTRTRHSTWDRIKKLYR